MYYTRKGDNGDSGLFGTKERAPKHNPVYEALGTLDEVNALLGILKAEAGVAGYPTVHIEAAQECLFIMQAALAGAEKVISAEHIAQLERTIDELSEHIPQQDGFVLPGACKLSALAEYARTVSRRAERRIIAYHEVYPLASELRAYSNRLSSYLFVLARYYAAEEECKEQHPSYQ